MPSAQNPGTCEIPKCVAISPSTSPMVPVALGPSTAGEEDWGFLPVQQYLRAVVLPFELTAWRSTTLWHLTIFCGIDVGPGFMEVPLLLQWHSEELMLTAQVWQQRGFFFSDYISGFGWHLARNLDFLSFLLSHVNREGTGLTGRSWFIYFFF